MKKISAVLVACSIGVAAQAQLVDDFSGDLSAYTSTVILDANGGGANTAAWQITGGGLELSTTAFDGIEQYAFINGGLTLNVGFEVQMDLTHSGASQDLGLYVGGTAPVAGTREDYVAVYARDNGQLFSRGFDGTTEYGLAGGSSPAYDSLFIARSGANTYEAGYYEGATRNVVVTRTPTFANEGDVVGFYADVRAAGTLGLGDNLTIAAIPEPTTYALLGLGLLGTVSWLRRRK
jgi:hypothetical protein